MAPSGRSIRRHTASLTEPPQRDRLRHTEETSCVVEDFAVADPRPEQSLDLDRQCGTPHRSLDSAHVLGGAGEFGVAAAKAAVACAYARATGKLPTSFPINHDGPLAFAPYPFVPPLPQSPTDGLDFAF